MFGHLACRLGDLLVGLVSEKRVSQVELLVPEVYQAMILGPLAEDTTELSGSFNRAKEALFWLKNRGAAPGIYRHENIIVDREMEVFSCRDGAGKIWARYWRPLGDRAPKQAVPLEKFARELIRSNFTLRACSRNLAVHYNTGRNYLMVLENILNLSLENEQDRFGLILAERIDAFRQGGS
jgi:sugar diacid utilization regulator